MPSAEVYRAVNMLLENNSKRESVFEQGFMEMVANHCIGKFHAKNKPFRAYTTARTIALKNPRAVMMYILTRHYVDVRFPGSDTYAVKKIFKAYPFKKRPGFDPSHTYSEIFAKYLVERAQTKLARKESGGADKLEKKPAKKSASRQLGVKKIDKGKAFSLRYNDCVQKKDFDRTI